MILKDAKGGVYVAHFSHKFDADGKGVHTTCRVHSGPCLHVLEPVRHCSVPLTGLGIARRNPHDVFKKAVGRKMAFQRAISALSRDLRQQLWSSYWTITPVARVSRNGAGIQR